MTGFTFGASGTVLVLSEFLWPFMRVAAMFSIAPVIGSKLVPVRVRVLLAVFITYAILPSLTPVAPVDPLSLDGIIVAIAQVQIGLSMGFILQLVFNAVSIAGENIAMTMGLGFAQITDPANGFSVPTVSQFFVVIASLLFLALNGHLGLIQMLADSFIHLPIDNPYPVDGALWLLLSWVGKMFAGAVMVALPAVTALLIVNVAMGIMTRAAPQMNLFSVGFPITMLIGFVLIFMTLSQFSQVFSALLDEGLAFIVRFLSEV